MKKKEIFSIDTLELFITHLAMVSRSERAIAEREIVCGNNRNPFHFCSNAKCPSTTGHYADKNDNARPVVTTTREYVINTPIYNLSVKRNY